MLIGGRATHSDCGSRACGCRKVKRRGTRSAGQSDESAAKPSRGFQKQRSGNFRGKGKAVSTDAGTKSSRSPSEGGGCSTSQDSPRQKRINRNSCDRNDRMLACGSLSRIVALPYSPDER